MIPASKPVSGVEVTESNEMSNVRPELRAWSGNPLEQMARKLLELDRRVNDLSGRVRELEEKLKK